MFVSLCNSTRLTSFFLNRVHFICSYALCAATTTCVIQGVTVSKIKSEIQAEPIYSKLKSISS